MTLEINNKTKTIKIIENTNIGELISFLETILPNDWKEYTLIHCVTKYEYYPYYNSRWINPYPLYPTIYCTTSGDSTTYTTKLGSYTTCRNNETC